jgi:hypothetical protein
MKRIVPGIYWRVGSEWRNRFRFENEPEINLSALVGDSLLHVRIEKIPAVVWSWNYVWKSRL